MFVKLNPDNKVHESAPSVGVIFRFGQDGVAPVIPHGDPLTDCEYRPHPETKVCLLCQKDKAYHADFWVYDAGGDGLEPYMLNDLETDIAAGDVEIWVPGL